MTKSPLCPLEGRYFQEVEPIRQCFSEDAFIHARLKVEISWFLSLTTQPLITQQEILPLNIQEKCLQLLKNYSAKDRQAIEEHETLVKHDVKAVELYIKEALYSWGAHAWAEWVHWGLTSEDVNNLAYGLLFLEGRITLQKKLYNIIEKLLNDSEKYADTPMISRTHGQAASPTTWGKEVANFAYRLAEQYTAIDRLFFRGKIGGAVGNLNAFLACSPQYDWPTHIQYFVESLQLHYHPYTTQIEPHDYIAQYSHILAHTNQIFLDLCRDIWMYISINYLGQSQNKQEVGSSTMPHKVNPILFENAEGNLGVANALLLHFAEKLPVSRWQRDLSDSTVMRNIGMALGYTFLAYINCEKGLYKINANTDHMKNDLSQHWELLAEPIQTALRQQGVPQSYELLKDWCRGQQNISQDNLHQFIRTLPVSREVQEQLLALTPHEYLGQASSLARSIRATVSAIMNPIDSQKTRNL